MKRFGWLPLLLLLALASPAGARVAVRIPFERANKHVFVAVTIGRSQPVWFLLDTGAKFTIVDLALADSLGLAKGDSVAVGGGGQHTVLGWLLKDSPYRVEGVPGYSAPLFLALPLDDLSRASGRRIAGVMGADFLGRYVVEIDYPRRTITLRDTAGYTYRGKGESLPITFNEAGHPLIHAQVVDAGRSPLEGNFVVDVGSGAAVILNRPFVEEHALLGSGRPTVPWLEARGLGGNIAGSVGRVSALVIGRFTVRDPVVVFAHAENGPFASTEMQGNIGAAVMEKFHVILDYAHRRIILEPNANLAERMEYDHSGLSLTSEGADFRTYAIAAVADSSPASEAGLRAGDVLAAVNGRAANAYSLSEIRELFQTRRTCPLTVTRGGEPVHITLRLRRII